MVDLLTRIDHELAGCVAEKLGISLTEEQRGRELPKPVCGLEADPALSLYASGEQVLRGRRVALLAADGVDADSVETMRAMFREQGIHAMLLAPHLGHIATEDGGTLKVDGSIGGDPSVLFDAVAMPEGRTSLETLMKCGKTRHYLWEAFKHLKPIALPGDTKAMLITAGLPVDSGDPGIVTGRDTASAMPGFLEAMKQHRIWSREKLHCKMPQPGK